MIPLTLFIQREDENSPPAIMYVDNVSLHPKFDPRAPRTTMIDIELHPADVAIIARELDARIKQDIAGDIRVRLYGRLII
jgi:hypothetical protein